MSVISPLVQEMVERDGSDLHLVAGDPPRMRLYGDLITMRDEPLKSVELEQVLGEIMPQTAVRVLAKDQRATLARLQFYPEA